MIHMIKNGKFMGYQLQGGDATKTFMTTQSRAIYQMVQNATPEQLRMPEMRKLIMDDYKQNSAKRLQGYENKSYSDTFSMLRGASPGEQFSYSAMLRANLSENLVDDMANTYVSRPVLDENGEQKRDDLGRLMREDNADDVLGQAGVQLEQDPVMMEILQAGKDALSTSSHFSGENEALAGPMAMNIALLRVISKNLSAKNTDAAIGVLAAANRKQNLSGVDRFVNLLKRK